MNKACNTHEKEKTYISSFRWKTWREEAS